MRSLFGAVAATVLFAQVALAADFAGSYDVQGTGPGGGGAYEGVVTIRKSGDGVYQVTWVIGKDTFVGTGIGGPGGLAVAYKSGSSTGIAIYRTGADGKVDGLWTYAGGKQIGEETWSPK